ncbi:MAG TPA: SDR family NAD(P)-dependent oxidoreductase, partial [Actinophytocola sp.]|nr:SDR family NAD(P)-dependent oxidoreductase [Actinophytocola sp.]
MAVIGMSCRLPGASTVDEFWTLLRDGRDAVTALPRRRREIMLAAGDHPDALDLVDRLGGGFVADVEHFDADFFRISASEARELDPQQRLLLELTWEAFEDARLVPSALAGTRTGVFVGATGDEYRELSLRRTGNRISHHTATGLNRGLMSGRVSYTFGLRGPSVTVDTAQSSSLVAVHDACAALRSGDCSLAVAGGVQLNLTADGALVMRRLGALSETGRCHTFDHRADGFVRGEGGGLVVLKRLADALTDGDHVHAVILGGAVNHGGASDALTRPSPLAQEELVRLACTRAGVAAQEVQYVELHGTGTKVGDPVEATALGAALGDRAPAAPLEVGSVKTNIGHLEAAAGIAGLLKTVLAIRHRWLPASLNFERPNPAIPLADLRLAVRTAGGVWPAEDGRLVAGVSSFGLGGTNCHLVLSEWDSPAEPGRAETEVPVPVVLSGHSQEALRAQAKALADWATLHRAQRPVDIGYALATTRAHLPYRAGIVASTRDELVGLLTGLEAGSGVPATPGRLAFLFSGQGSQRNRMFADVYRDRPRFAAALDEVLDELDAVTDRPVRDIMFAEEGTETGALLDDTAYTQPALFAVEVALYRLLTSWGVVPDVLLGHSLGEVAAAHVAGVLSLADACLLVAEGGRLTASTPAPGASHLDPVLDEFRAVVRRIELHPPTVPIISGVTGMLADPAELCSADYWLRQLRQPVRFGHGVRSAHEFGVDTYVELGPAPALTPMARATVRELHPSFATTFVTTARSGTDHGRAVLRAAVDLHAAGRTIDWDVVFADMPARAVTLPTYRFQRERHWLADEDAPVPVAAGYPAVVEQVRPETEGGQRTVALVRREVGAVLGAAPSSVDPHRTFSDLGLDSLMSTELGERLNEALGTSLYAGILFDHPTVAELAAHLDGAGSPVEPRESAPGDVAGDPIAIVGMSCRLPGGVASAEDLWDLVATGTDAITTAPANRGWRSFTDQPGGFVADVDQFDAEFFGISPREAAAMDPQQRLVLEGAWQALETAGIDPTSLRGSDTGTFVGVMAPDYGPRMAERDPAAEGYVLTGTTPSVVSGRVAYVLGLEGPAVSVDTACSSSLVALHQAAAALRRGDCALALAGGVTVMSTPGMFVEFTRQAGLAADGRCKSFADSADGTGWGEGMGMLVLERLSAARSNGHRVLAVIRGSAINQDGASNGLTAPNGPAQQRLIRGALADAGLAASDVDAVEAHGTGTRLGDPIEAQAILGTYGTRHGAPLWLGSIKSNLGHTQAAAGVAGVIKMVQALRHGMLPRSLHVDRPSSRVDWTAGAVRLLSENQPWPRGDRPRRAGVSSFGISGTNAHLIVEEAPAEAPAAVGGGAAPGGRVPLLVSARSEDGLRAQAEQLHTFLTEHPDLDPTAVATTLARSRAGLSHRAAVVGADTDELLAGLAAVASGSERVAAAVPGGAVFVFPGQGSQWTGMGRELLATSPVFAESISECEAALAPFVDWSLSEILATEAPLTRVDVVQPALWAVMVSLARLWRAGGVEPVAVVGHSQGEIAAACVAGGVTLADGARLVALRSRVLAELAGTGGMMSVAAPVDEVTALIARWGDRLSVGAINGPSSVVVSGDADALAELATAATQAGVRTRRIDVDYPSHSARVDKLRDDILSALAPVRPLTSQIPLYSTLTGATLDTSTMDADYWYRNLREPVRFHPVIHDLIDAGHVTFLEVSPHPLLAPAIEQTAEAAGWRPGDVAALSTLKRDQSETRGFATALGRAHVRGIPVDWPSVLPAVEPVELPAYAFQRQRFWLEVPEPAADDRLWRLIEDDDPAGFARAVGTDLESGGVTDVLHGLRTWRDRRQEQDQLASWCYRVEWASVPTTAARLSGTWLAFVPAEPDPPAWVLDCLAAIRTAGGLVREIPVAADADPAELAALSEGPDIAGVVSLVAGLTGWCADGVPAGLAATVTLLRVLGDRGVAAPMWTVTHGATSVETTGDAADPWQAMLWGLGRVAALEHPDRWGGLIDVPADLPARLQGWFTSLLAGGTGEDQVAVRRSGVHARRLRPHPRLADAAGASRPPGGTVLITGGTGALGGHVARWVASHGAERIVLASRQGPTAPGADRLVGELGDLGVAVDVLACDLGDRDAVSSMVRSVDGPAMVVHAAVALHDGVVATLTTEQLATVCRAKALGAWHLHEALADRPDCELVFFSSLSGVEGVPGQGGYAAANAFLDALAAWRRAKGLSATSVAWGPWAGDGVASGTVAARFERHGVPPMTPDRALAALGGVLAAGTPEILVADIDWERHLVAFTATRPSPLHADLATPGEFPDPAGQQQAGSGLRDQLAGRSPAEVELALLDVVRKHAALVLGFADAQHVGVDQAFRDGGFDSLTAVELRNRLLAATGVALTATAVFDHPTPRAMAEFLRGELFGATRAPVRAGSGVADEPIAIVGVGARFPGGPRSAAELWELLLAGADATSGLPTNRGWSDVDLRGAPHHGGFLHDADLFDAGFFGISPREALAMDPQQRVLLETAWQAVESAGVDPATLRGAEVGSFVGVSGQDYGLLLHAAAEQIEGYAVTGAAASVLSGRLAYLLGLEGPTITVDTACSSSLVAIHLAVQALRRGECSLALAGGVTVMSTPGLFPEFERQGALAADGRCKAFSDAADGMGLAEGCGVVVLEPLSVAQAKGHRVWAVVRGSAVNQDGASNGLTAPNGPAQQRVIRSALADAGLSPSDVDAVEAHGTGTALGDPVEAQALLATYGQDRAAPAWLGSVKSNLGHTQAAAGVVGVVKMVLALRREMLPRSLHIDRPSSHVDWAAGALALLTENQPWPGGDRPRRAGVSSFGISGTNAHLILEEAPVDPRPAEVVEPVVADVVPWSISGRGEAALRAQAAQLHAFLLEHDELAPRSVGATLARSRAGLSHRAVVVGADRAELLAGLAAVAAGEEPVRPAVAGGAVFVFPGQGSQWAGMGRELLATSPVFAESIHDCEVALGSFVDWSLTEVLTAADENVLARVDVLQPALWAVMVSLARLWRACGVEPLAVVGHSQGEIAAACVAGGLSLEDGARIVASRSRILTALAGNGGMVSVAASEAEVRERVAAWGGRLSVAAINGPSSVVVSGDPAALAELITGCEAAGVRARQIEVDYASHSVQVDGLRAEILAALKPIRPRTSEIPLYSTLTGEPLDTAEMDPGYWFRNLREPVRFHPVITDLIGRGHHTFIEASPHPVLVPAVYDTADRHPDAPDVAAIATLRRQEPQARRFVTALGEAHVRGVPVEWDAVIADGGPPVDLPGYAFQGRRYWLEVAPHRTAGAVDSWRYGVEWVPVPVVDARLSGSWLVAVPDGAWPGWVSACVDAVRGAGAQVRELRIGPDADRAELSATLSDVGDVAGVVSLVAGLAGWQEDGVPAGLAVSLALVQALGDAAVAAPVWTVTCGGVATSAVDGAGDAWQSMLWGFGQVAGLEHPDRWGGLIDVPADFGGEAPAFAGVLAGAGEDQVAIRQGGALGRRLRRATRRAGDGWRLPGGAVVITGGTGGVGAWLARWVAERGAERIVLVSRRGPDAPGAPELVAELDALGVTASAVACDIGDRDAVSAVLAEAARDVPLRMVVHAAVALDDGVLDTLTPARFAGVARAKVLGARHLHELTADLPDCHLVLFSSLSGVVGAAGQANYAAANTFLHGLAATRRARALPTTVVAWGAWAGGGSVDTELAVRFERRGLRLMRPADALAALDASLVAGDESVLIADIDWRRYAPTFTATRPSPLLTELVPADREALAESDRNAIRDRLAGLSAEEVERALLAVVRTHAAAALGFADPDDVATDLAFRAVGFDSLIAVDFRNRLVAATGLRVAATAAFDYPTPRLLARYLNDELAGARPAPAPTVSPTHQDEPIAVVGMGCRLPGGVGSPAQLWDLVDNGVDAMAGFPTNRGWPTDRPTYTAVGGFVDDVDRFDAEFFGISPREALAMDPQQRILLETVWEALEHAGIDPMSLRGSDTGAYVGMNGQDYALLLTRTTDNVAGYAMTGSSGSVLSGRVSYVLGLEGPAVSVDTACSSSLVAIHLAVQALRRGECSLALAGGVTVLSTPGLFGEFARQGGLAADGRCKAFADDADGTGWGEGCGVLVLERLSVARERGHRVLAVVRGSAVNQDGASSGLTAPNGPSQQRVIRAALADAGLVSSDVDAVEAHGTGTTLGDPIEAQAILATYGQDREVPLWL